MNKFPYIIAFLLISLGIVWYAIEPRVGGGELIPPDLQLKADKEKILDSKEVDDIRINKDTKEVVNLGKIKSYDYITDEKVTDNVYFKDGEVYSNTVIKGEGKMRFFVGDHFYKDKDSVYKIEHGATTTIEAFNEQTKENIISRLFKKALAAPIYSSAGDGMSFAGDPTWSTVRGFATGEGGTPTVDEGYFVRDDKFGEYTIGRAFLPFDTSAIPDGSSISSSSVFIFTSLTENANLDGYDYEAVVETTQPSNSTFTTADYDLFGTTVGSAEYTFPPTGGYVGRVAFLLNSTGRGWIKTATQTSSCGATAGWTCLGLRAGHDIENQVPVNYSYNYGYWSEKTGTANDPYLDVVYSAGSPASAPPANQNIIIFE